MTLFYEPKKPQKFDDNIVNLCDELQKILRVTQQANMPSHLETAQNMLENLTTRWNLNTKDFINPVYVAVQATIDRKYNDFQKELF